MNDEKTLIKGTIILASSSILVKILSAGYKIPLTRMLGAGVMGNYTAVFNIFMPFYAFATAGIIPSVSRLAAEISTQGNESLLALKRKCSMLFVSFSFLMTFFAILVAFFYEKQLGSDYLFLGVLLLAPNLLMATEEGIYKGISQGSLNMMVSAKANLLESAAKLIIGLGAVFYVTIAIKQNTGFLQLMVSLATVSISGFICWWYMSNDFKVLTADLKKIKSTITTKRIINLAFPISLSALIVAGVNFFDTVVCLSIIEKIPRIEITKYYNIYNLENIDNIAIWLFGIYHGLVLTVINLIPTLSCAIGQSGLPVITKSKIENNYKKLNYQVSKLLKLTSVSVIPICFFVLVFSDEVIITLFGDKGTETILASMFLKFLAPTAILSSFSFPFNAILHAYEKSKDIFKILFISSIFKAVLSFVLCSIPSVNIKGCLYSSWVFYILEFLLSIREVKKTDIKLNMIYTILVPLIIGYISISVVRIFCDLILENMPIIIQVGISGIFFVSLYGILILISEFLVDIQP